MVFSKIDKKVLVILIIVFIVILLAGFAVYKYMFKSPNSTQNIAGGVKIENAENDDTPQIQVQMGDIQVQGDNGTGGLTVCSDQCGNGICQQTDPNCDKNNLSCICQETPQDCPQDCKN